MKTKPVLIIVLLLVTVILLVANVYNIQLSKLFNSEHFQGTPKPTDNTPDLFENTHSMSELTDKGRLNDMFGSLEDAEKRCDIIQSRQLQREQKQEMRENDKTYKELLEQDKKIHELKEIVKYLTIEKKRRDKINNKCKAQKQGKLNENYNIVKALNKEGLVKDNSVELDLNISDSTKLQKLLKSMQKNNRQYLEGTSTKDHTKCPSRGKGDIDIDKIGDKCHGCDTSKLKEMANNISRDFN